MNSRDDKRLRLVKQYKECIRKCFNITEPDKRYEEYLYLRNDTRQEIRILIDEVAAEFGLSN